MKLHSLAGLLFLLIITACSSTKQKKDDLFARRYAENSTSQRGTYLNNDTMYTSGGPYALVSVSTEQYGGELIEVSSLNGMEAIRIQKFESPLNNYHYRWKFFGPANALHTAFTPYSGGISTVIDELDVNDLMAPEGPISEKVKDFCVGHPSPVLAQHGKGLVGRDAAAHVTVTDDTPYRFVKQGEMRVGKVRQHTQEADAGKNSEPKESYVVWDMNDKVIAMVVITQYNTHIETMIDNVSHDGTTNIVDASGDGGRLAQAVQWLVASGYL